MQLKDKECHYKARLKLLRANPDLLHHTLEEQYLHLTICPPHHCLCTSQGPWQHYQ